jgi:hypothetical protein
VEHLEDRTVPSILFHQGVAVTLSDHNDGQARGPVLTNPQVELVFWGSNWDTGSNPSLRTKVITAVDSILRGPYTTALGQYGIGTGVLAGNLTITSSSPGANFTDANVSTTLISNINNATITYNQNLLYVVITQPSSTDPTDPPSGLLGNHSVATASGNRSFYYGWTENVGGTGALDDITKVFSHEYAEAVTDPAGTAYQVAPRNTRNWNEISDGEAQNYTFRVNNYLLQSYYSQSDNAFVVPNGSTNNFLVDTKGVLTFQEFPFGNNSITMSRVNNGVFAELNNSTAQFDPSKITGITVNGLNGDSITIEQTGAEAPVTVNLGSGSERVDISPRAKDLSRIEGNVSIKGGSGKYALQLDDSQGSSLLYTTYTLTAGQLTRVGNNIVFSSRTSISYQNITNIELYGGFGANTYYVQSTAAGTSLTIKTGKGVNTMVVGDTNHTLDGLSGTLQLEGGGIADALQFDDSQGFSPLDTTYTLTAGRLTRVGAYGFFSSVASISYQNIASIELDGGLLLNTYNVQGTAAGSSLTIKTGNGINNTVVGDTNHTLNGLSGALQLQGGGIVDTLQLDDSLGLYLLGTTYTLTAGQLTRLGADVLFSSLASISYQNMANIELDGGESPLNTYNVQGTAAGSSLTIKTGVGFNATVVGDTNSRLDAIQGSLTIDGRDGTNILTINDQGTQTAQLSTLTATTLSRKGAAVITYANVADLTVNTGSGSGTAGVFGVLSTPAGTPVTVNDLGSGSIQFVVTDNASTLDGIQGPLALHGRASAGDFLSLSDFHNTATQTYALVANSVSRSGMAPISFEGQTQLILYASQQPGTAVNVQSVAAGVFTPIGVGPGSTVTLGSQAPGLGGTLANLLGPVRIQTDSAQPPSVIIDDSGDTAGRQALFNTDGSDYGVSGLAPARIYWEPAAGAAMNVQILGGAGDKSCNVQGTRSDVALSIDGGSGTNTLDYTDYAGNVLVDLPLGVATGLSGISHFQNVRGASGGPAGSYNLLVGNGGNVLTGGTGRRNLLVAGAAASQLYGGDDQDILIGGTTDYDTNLAMLRAIADYWAASADDLPTRLANLTSGTGVPLLDATTVHGNGGGNSLSGSGAWALIFTNGMETDPKDGVSGFDPASLVVRITP